MQEVKEFVIKRSEWGRGNNDGSSCLLDENGKKCCLGFYMLACGVTPEQILNEQTPAIINPGKSNVPKWLLNSSTYMPTHACYDLMIINDYNINTFDRHRVPELRCSSEKEREQKIIAGFAKQGITVTIID